MTAARPLLKTSRCRERAAQMQPHPFRLAIERRARGDELARLFVPDAVLHSLMLSKPVTGVERVTREFEITAKAAAPTRFTYEVSDGRRTMLFWEGTAGGFKLQGATILVDGDDG